MRKTTKLITLLAFFMLFEVGVMAQDIIILINGTEIKSKVLEDYPEYIEYSKFNDQAGEIYTETKANIFKIKYASGDEDIFNEIAQPIERKQTETPPITIPDTTYYEEPKNKQRYVPPAAISPYSTDLFVTDISDAEVVRKINAGVSALLTEFNKVYFENRTPMLKNIHGLSKEGKKDILAMWETTPFCCIETKIIERGLRTPSGWQVRNIPIWLKDMPDGDGYKEIAINFDNSGNIEEIYFALEMHHYQAIMYGEGNEVTDLRRRQLILNFVENFKTAYNRKDIGLINKVFSEDALIITGKVVKKVPQTDNMLTQSGFLQEEIEYQVKTKKDYISKLHKVFRNNDRINVDFNYVEVMRHPIFEDIYGVTLKQYWNTTRYSDVGWLFLMIDFKDGENMEIHVRTWQPEIGPNGIPLSEDDIFQLGKYNVSK